MPCVRRIIRNRRLASDFADTHEARVLIGLMANEVYPGLVRDNVPGPVAHKAGWLGNVQNDLALAFGTRGGTCVIGITTPDLSFSSADSVGRELADRVLPLLAVQRSSVKVAPAHAGAAAAPPPPAQRQPPPPAPARERHAARLRTSADGGLSWAWWLLAAGLAAVGCLLIARGASLRRRKRRRAKHGGWRELAILRAARDLRITMCKVHVSCSSRMSGKELEDDLVIEAALPVPNGDTTTAAA